MIEFKFYKELKELAEILGLPSDKETLRLYVKLVEKFNESQVKEVNRLKLKNLEGRLQHGQIGVNRKDIKEHLKICKRVVHGVDEAMKLPVNFVRGSRIAKLMSELDNSLFTIGLSAHMASSVEGQAEFEDELIKAFNKRQDDLTLKAAFDGTKRRNLRFSLDLEGSLRGGTVNYNKKASRFDFIEYNLNGYAKQIPI